MESKVTPPSVSDDGPRLLPFQKRRHGSYKHQWSGADIFATWVEELAWRTTPETIETMRRNADEIRRYPEAAAMVDDLDRMIADLRVLSDMIRNGPRSCEHCGGPLGGRSDARYCSARCRQGARRKRIQP